MVAKSLRTSTRRQQYPEQISSLSHHSDQILRTWLYGISFGSLIFLFGCAEIGAPPGGPVDRSGPFILDSNPANGSTNVPSSDRVTITFSEIIVGPSSGNAVFVSPRPTKELKLKWQSDRLTIIFPDSFKTNQTYVLSVNNTVKDLHNNSVDSNIIIAFSTGPMLDSGRVSGRVENESGPAAGVQVALFDMALLGESPDYDSLYPDYLVGGNRDGEFRFSNIPDREYRLIAYVDRDRNELLSPYQEQFGVADRRIIVGAETETENLRIPLTSLDSGDVRLLSVQQTVDGLVRANLSKEIQVSYLARSPSGGKLLPADSTLSQIVATAFLESERLFSRTFTFYFPIMPPGLFRLELDWSASEPPIFFDSLNILEREDRNPPSLMRFRPEPSPSFLDKSAVSLRFTEPIDTSAVRTSSFTLWIDDTIIVPSEAVWSDPFGVHLETEPLREGKSYRLDVTEFDILDLSGNPLGDSLIQRSFQLFDPDSLGTISGEIFVLLDHRKNDPAILSFRKLDNDRVFDLPVSSKTFSIALPPGKYLLSGFLDSDDDARRGKGSLLPFVFSETTSEYPDTIRVRARFETSGIQMEFK